MTRVWPLRMAHTDKLVLLALADNANDDGECWPRISAICEKTCLSDRAVQHCINHLVVAGHVTVTPRYRQSNVFLVHPKEVYPERPSGENCSGENPSPERNDISTPNVVHPYRREPSKRTVSSRKTKKHEIPNDFDLTPERKAYAEKHLPHVDSIALMATFRSTSKAKGWKYVDWDQHWQTLVRQWAPNSGHWSSGQYPRTESQRWM